MEYKPNQTTLDDQIQKVSKKIIQIEKNGNYDNKYYMLDQTKKPIYTTFIGEVFIYNRKVKEYHTDLYFD